MSTVKLLTSVDGAPAGALLHRDLVYLRQLVSAKSEVISNPLCTGIEISWPAFLAGFLFGYRF